MESIDNIFQLIVSGLCTAVAMSRAISTGKRPWTLLAVYYTASLLADLYWQLFYAFSGNSPRIFYVADMGWYVSSLFLYIFLTEISLRRPGERVWVMWIVPVFTAGMCIYYMLYGDYISNVVAATIMSLLGCEAINGLHAVKLREKENAIDSVEATCYRRVYICAIILFLMIYGTWTSSCFFKENTFTNPYYWFDILMSVDRIFILLFAHFLIRSIKKDTAQV